MEARDDSSEEAEEPFLRPGIPTDEERTFPVHPTHSTMKIVIIIAFMIFILAFGGTLMVLPAIRVYEDVLCHQYYEKLPDHGHISLAGQIDEKLCKGEEIQTRLNTLLGGLAVLGSIPGILMAMPYGLLVDRIGRKKVFALSAVGIILGGMFNLTVLWFSNIFPLYLVLLSPLFTFIGGGEATLGTIFFSIGSDISTEANRANVFLFGGSGSLVAGLIAPSVASVLMMRSPWIAMLIGFGVIIIGCILFMLLVPETLHLHPLKTSDLDSDLESENQLDGVTEPLLADLRSKFWENIKDVRAAVTIFRSLPILLLLVTFVISPFGLQSGTIALRYISNQYGWTLAEATFLLSLRGLLEIILLLILLPVLSYFITRRLHYSPKEKDLYLAQGSAVVQLVAALLLALGSNIGMTVAGLAVWSLGSGLPALVRSLLTTLVDKQHTGRLNAAIGIVETMGALVAAPSLAVLYSLGLHWKGAWVTLPFDALATVAFLCGSGVWCFWFFGFLGKKNPVIDEGNVLYSDEQHYTDDVVPL
ncbi:major facilitator superfamily domain-containing protein [Xylogone sp. PMI_703]|nr:major facilitator superfamily domain-containing protein [Xylogone sp. PMI_703]